MKTEILIIKSKIAINPKEIIDIQGLEYRDIPEKESELYAVKVYMSTPYIYLLCDDIETAKILYKSLLKSRPVVDINEMRAGK